ncbi:hypothetical protein KY345_00785 [Candidatus Woesearchaeota archaeon]|nr:hypothetical protein [Candidatus Woesearchaeota archaeon]
MDDRDKAKLLVFGFLVFIVVAAALISNSREKITGGAVVGEDCEIECTDYTDCDDGDESTLDGCAYPGTCASRCFNEYRG